MVRAAVIAMVALAISSTALLQQALAQTDQDTLVDPSHWSYAALAYIASYGAFEGCPVDVSEDFLNAEPRAPSEFEELLFWLMDNYTWGKDTPDNVPHVLRDLHQLYLPDFCPRNYDPEAFYHNKPLPADHWAYAVLGYAKRHGLIGAADKDPNEGYADLTPYAIGGLTTWLDLALDPRFSEASASLTLEERELLTMLVAALKSEFGQYLMSIQYKY